MGYCYLYKYKFIQIIIPNFVFYVGIGSLRWSSSPCCADWRMNSCSDRSLGSKSFRSSASCPSRTTRGSWAPPGRSSSCWPAWRSTARRFWETSPTWPTNTHRQTTSCRGELQPCALWIVLNVKHFTEEHLGSLLKKSWRSVCGVYKWVWNQMTSEPSPLDLLEKFTAACWVQTQGIGSKVVKHSYLANRNTRKVTTFL